MSAAILAAVVPAPAAAQELALKGGIAISRFEVEGDLLFDRSFTSTAFGAHYRRRLGPIAIQPEIYMVSKGGRFRAETGEERMKLDYIELPLLLVVPVTVGPVEPYAFAGPYLAVESRCRYSFEDRGLKTNLGCESASGIFDRRALDYGFTVGGGAAHPLGSGRLMLEARHTRGTRDIYDGEDEAAVRNRSIVVMLGYTINLQFSER